MKTLTNIARILYIVLIIFMGLVFYEGNPDIQHVFLELTKLVLASELIKSFFKYGFIFMLVVYVLMGLFEPFATIFAWGMFGMMVISMFTEYLKRRNVKRQEKAMKRRRALTLEKIERRKQARYSGQTQYSNISTNDLINELNHRQQLSEAE